MMDKSDIRTIVRQYANDLSVLSSCDPESDDWSTINDRCADIATLLQTISRDAATTSQACAELFQAMKNGDGPSTVRHRITALEEAVSR